VKVPDVVGLPQRTAMARLKAEGFQVQVVFEDTGIRRESGRVISQAPGAGAELEEGYPVAIIVGRFVPAAEAPQPAEPPPPEEDR
jgi:beta-lactam-binding protein with PASTA domain